jgi:hypothetical protein
MVVAAVGDAVANESDPVAFLEGFYLLGPGWEKKNKRKNEGYGKSGHGFMILGVNFYDTNFYVG